MFCRKSVSMWRVGHSKFRNSPESCRRMSAGVAHSTCTASTQFGQVGLEAGNHGYASHHTFWECRELRLKPRSEKILILRTEKFYHERTKVWLEKSSATSASHNPCTLLFVTRTHSNLIIYAAIDHFLKNISKILGYCIHLCLWKRTGGGGRCGNSRISWCYFPLQHHLLLLPWPKKLGQPRASGHRRVISRAWTRL